MCRRPLAGAVGLARRSPAMPAARRSSPTCRANWAATGDQVSPGWLLRAPHLAVTRITMAAADAGNRTADARGRHAAARMARLLGMAAADGTPRVGRAGRCATVVRDRAPGIPGGATARRWCSRGCRCAPVSCAMEEAVPVAAARRGRGGLDGRLVGNPPRSFASLARSLSTGRFTAPCATSRSRRPAAPCGTWVRCALGAQCSLRGCRPRSGLACVDRIRRVAGGLAALCTTPKHVRRAPAAPVYWPSLAEVLFIEVLRLYMNEQSAAAPAGWPA